MLTDIRIFKISLSMSLLSYAIIIKKKNNSNKLNIIIKWSMSKSSKNIVLVGMSGVGKTTVGRILSKKLDKEFIDIDNEFENITKFKIADFFNKYGEIEFRKIEKKNYNEYNTK